MITNVGTVREGEERFHLVKHVILKIFSLSMCMILVIIILWPSECYLTVFVVAKMRTLPQSWVAFAGGRLRNSAQWRWMIWLASVIMHVLEELLKNPAVIRSDQIKSELWAVVWVTGNIIIRKNGWQIRGDMEDDHQRQLWWVHEGSRYDSSSLHNLLIIRMHVILQNFPFC